jgi:hypothetical protein
MSKKAAEHHKQSAEHHTHAARHHGEAAKHHEGGDHEKAAHHAHTARGHALHARASLRRSCQVSYGRTRQEVVIETCSIYGWIGGRLSRRPLDIRNYKSQEPGGFENSRLPFGPILQRQAKHKCFGIGCAARSTQRLPNLWDRHFTCQRPQLFYFRLTPYAMFRLFHRR